MEEEKLNYGPCGKVMMPQHVAERAARKFRRFKHDKAILPYYCRICSGWHVGHDFTGKSKKVMATGMKHKSVRRRRGGGRSWRRAA